MSEPDDHDRDDVKVGYGKPPSRSRFQKGKSGNPRGRPKGSGMRSAVEKVAARWVTMTVEGKRRRVPVTEALLMQLLQGALAGDAPARRDFLRIADQVPQARAEKETKEGGQTVVIRRFGEPTGCNGALAVLEVITEVGGGSGTLKVQPWVIEAALARGLRLSEADQTLVEEFTVKSEDTVIARDRR
jgi:hypothetical protein